MTDAEIKQLVREKGACGEVFVGDRGVKVTCLITCEQHHAEAARMREGLRSLRILVRGMQQLEVDIRDWRVVIEAIDRVLA